VMSDHAAVEASELCVLLSPHAEADWPTLLQQQSDEVLRRRARNA
jgi:hypothetical protein